MPIRNASPWSKRSASNKLVFALALLAMLSAAPTWGSQTRVMDFETPALLPGTYDYYQGVEEFSQHGFSIVPSDSAGALDALSRIHPSAGAYPLIADNGTSHMSALNLAQPHIYRPDANPFDLLSLDLAEYSAVFAEVFSVTVIGQKSGGGSVLTSFELDGVIDGFGSVDDFEHFTLGSEWTDLLGDRCDALASLETPRGSDIDSSCVPGHSEHRVLELQRFENAGHFRFGPVPRIFLADEGFRIRPQSANNCPHRHFDPNPKMRWSRNPLVSGAQIRGSGM